MSYAELCQFAARESEIYASFTFLDTTGTIHHLPVSDSRKYHPLSAVIPRLPCIPGQRRNFRKELQFFPLYTILLEIPRPPAVAAGHCCSVSRPGEEPARNVRACITLSRAREQHHLAGEYENPAKQDRWPLVAS